MERIVIEGGKKLSGNVQIMGSKNEVLKLLIAATLCTGTVEIQNVPDIEDVHRVIEILRAMGAEATYENHIAIINADSLKETSVPEELATKIRASVVLLGPILARYGKVILPPPGGDKIGKRPIDFFLTAFKKLGAHIEQSEHGYTLSAVRLKGTEIVFPQISVTATETLMMAATLSDGVTTLYNAAVEPEVVALANKLVEAGAKITGQGTHTIQIEGVSKLQQTSPWVTIPDRIEAGTFAILAAATRSEITISDCRPEDMRTPIETLRAFGVEIELEETSLHIQSHKGMYEAQIIKTHEYPGFSTDLQPQMSVLLTQATGMSMIHETIFEGRLHYLETLKKFGANVILFDPHRAAILGPTPLIGTTVESSDIRAGLAFVIAGLIAEGTTKIENIYHIKRGAERIVERLQNIGATISVENKK